MRRAWVVLLAGCGFQSQTGQQAADANLAVDAADIAIDASKDAAVDGTTIPSAACWRIESDSEDVHLLACPSAIAEPIDISVNVSINTTTGASTPAGFACELISDGPDDICALTARSITLRAGVTLTAHGARPLALLAHDIDVQGTIDVASHLGQPRGPGATLAGCNYARGALKSGGGAGGGYNHPGGAGGDQGGQLLTGAAGSNTIGVKSLRGGCDGTGGGDGSDDGGPPGPGGGAGGAVWLSADSGALTIGDSAIINASGAGGAAGTDSNNGGAGGGSGGLVVLQAPTINRPSTSSMIFTTGGGGGGGAANGTPGQPGGDPSRPGPGGTGGDGADTSGADKDGDGGDGDPFGMRNGAPGSPSDGGSAGGGGGGSAGLVWVISTTQLSNINIDPDPLKLGP